MEGRELRRCYTQMEFPVTRSRGDKQHQIRTSKRFAMPSSNRMKFPTLEIYRPPGQRVDGSQIDSNGSKLNVYAKEFVSLHTSRSVGNMLSNNTNGDGPTKKGLANNNNSSNNSNNKSPNSTVGYPLQYTKSTSIKNVSHTQSKVQWDMGDVGDRNNNRIPGKVTELKRSKSMSSAHSSSSSSSTVLPSKLIPTSLDLPIGPDHSLLPPDIQRLAKASYADPNKYSTADLINLAKQLVEKATEERQYAERLATYCANIIEKEVEVTFLESLINSCQYALQKRSSRDTNGSKYYAFMAFLSHLYTLMKRLPLDDKCTNLGIAPNSALLCLLVQCCQGSLKEPILKLRQEIECLFFVITTIGRELEQEQPKQLETLMNSVRDSFLNGSMSDPIRKTLMQLIELHASRWQLPAFAVMYYQSSSMTDLP